MIVMFRRIKWLVGSMVVSSTVPVNPGWTRWDPFRTAHFSPISQDECPFVIRCVCRSSIIRYRMWWGCWVRSDCSVSYLTLLLFVLQSWSLSCIHDKLLFIVRCFTTDQVVSYCSLVRTRVIGSTIDKRIIYVDWKLTH